MDLQMLTRQPLKPHLSGLELEYRILQVYAKEPGKEKFKNLARGLSLELAERPQSNLKARVQIWMGLRIPHRSCKWWSSSFLHQTL